MAEACSSSGCGPGNLPCSGKSEVSAIKGGSSTLTSDVIWGRAVMYGVCDPCVAARDEPAPSPMCSVFGEGFCMMSLIIFFYLTSVAFVKCSISMVLCGDVPLWFIAFAGVWLSGRVRIQRVRLAQPILRIRNNFSRNQNFR